MSESVSTFFHGRVTTTAQVDDVLAVFDVFSRQRSHVACADDRYRVTNERARERCPHEADALIAIVYSHVKRDAEDSEYPQCQQEAFEEYERLLNGAIDAIVDPGFEW